MEVRFREVALLLALTVAAVVGSSRVHAGAHLSPGAPAAQHAAQP